MKMERKRVTAIEANKDFQLKEGLCTLKCIPEEQDRKYQMIIAEISVFYMQCLSPISARGDYKFCLAERYKTCKGFLLLIGSFF